MNEGLIEQVDAPYLVYNKPRTRFVAGFMGERTSSMRGAKGLR